MKNRTSRELNLLTSVKTGLCMLGIEKYTKGEQINWWVSVQAYSTRNSEYFHPKQNPGELEPKH